MNRGGRVQYNRGGSNNRYSSSRGRGGAARGGPKSTVAKGVFSNGIWHCNCTPRLPAEHFKVKKEGKNQGRWFYTCQNQQAQRCDFFLWDEDAKLREEGAVLNNSRTEPSVRPTPGVQDGWDAGRSRGGAGGMFSGANPFSVATGSKRQREEDESTEEGSPPPPCSTQHNTRNPPDNRLNGADEEDELLEWPLTGQEEQDLVNAADSAAALPETPRKVAKTGVYATPSTTIEKKRIIPWLQTPQVEATAPTTPNTSKRRSEDEPASPSKPPTKCLPPIPEQLNPKTPSLQAKDSDLQIKSPSPPTRHKDALANPADSSSSLTSEALATLRDLNIPQDVLSSLRGVLSKHDLKNQGVVKGRDISRVALKAKEAKIVELQARIASLEAEREVDRGIIKGLRWESEYGERGVIEEE